MKIICSKQNLSEGINIVQKAVSTKTTMPILEGILLEAGEKFKLTGNDLEIGIECFVEADIIRSGSVVINARMLGEIIRKLPDSEVMIEIKENNLVVIDCDNSLFEIKGLSAEGFPELASVDKHDGFKIPQKTVRDMIKQTLFAVSTDENRPILTGTFIECKDNNITFVSIDGFRLAVRKASADSEIKENGVIVPGKTLNEISKIIQPIDDEMTIYTSRNQIMFDMGKCKVISTLIEGEYLNYKSIIPSEHETRMRINTKEMLSSLERASLVITSEERRYPVKFDISNDKIVITSNTDIGNVREEINVELEGADIDIAFNPRYFIDALRVIEDELIDIYFTSSIGPSTIKSIKGDDYSYMVLPIRR